MQIEKQSILAKPLVAALLASFCALLWGSAYPAIKLGYELFAVGADDTPAKMAFAGLRFALAGLLVFLVPGLPRGGRSKVPRAWMESNGAASYCSR